MDTLSISGLYPPIQPFSQGTLDVGDGHELYWEQSGVPWGVPVIYLHGGPGAGCSPNHRQFFDPDRYRVILLDQRGCGRSRPQGDVSANTTADLVADIEALRRHLSIPKWLVVGGSWGSTLSLAYGEAHPDKCLGFVLRGVFLFEEAEVDWFLHGMGRFFPEARAKWLGYLPEDQRQNPLEAYSQLLNDPDPSVHGSAAYMWNAYESACSSLYGPSDDGLNGKPPTVIGGNTIALARLEVHYMLNKGFMAEKQLMDNLSAITHLPAVIIQGRYDVICPMETANKVALAWPGCMMTVIDDAGHSVFEPGIRSAMVMHLNRFAKEFCLHRMP